MIITLIYSLRTVLYVAFKLLKVSGVKDLQLLLTHISLQEPHVLVIIINITHYNVMGISHHFKQIHTTTF